MVDARRGAAVALTIAGSDSGGGAGIQADLKTFSALGVYGASVVTALTAQNTLGVTAVEAASGDIVRAQLEAVLGDLPVGAIKIGMLADPGTIGVVAEALEQARAPVVLDPVMIAKSGHALLSEPAVAALRERLISRADLLTPNLPEAARLLEADEAADEAAMEAQGRALLDLGAAAVLVKGGHGRGAVVVDLLVRRDGATVRLEAPRIDTQNTHGTGCTLSAAVAAGLAKGLALDDAVRGAHGWLQKAIGGADRLRIGSGRGPVHHFNGIWAAP